MVVQWTAWGFYLATSARLTFQAKLFEGTNVVEFHYCDLAPGTTGTRATGDSATVGIENLLGTRGYQASFETAGSIMNQSAIRLTPQ